MTDTIERPPTEDDWLREQDRLRAEVESDDVIHHTEMGLADEIVREHGAKMRYAWGWNAWLAWDGKRWVPKADDEIWRMAKASVQPLLSRACRLPLGDERTAAVKYALRCEKEQTIRAALSLARSDSRISIRPEALNRDVYLLNTESGIVDLRTGALRPHDPAALLTRLCPTAYNPAARSALWEQFLERIFAGDQEKISYVRRLFGYAATGCCREHLLPIFWGKGHNGKSTLTEAIEAALGRDYAGPIARSLLFDENKNAHPTAVADLYGRRLAVTHESDAGSRLNEGLVKNLTGGDTLNARRMKEDFWSFAPTHTLILATNNKPVIRGTDDGIWRRLKLIPFTVQIPEAEWDTALKDKLKAQAPAVLAWIVEGARDWHQNGSRTPKSVQVATAEYRSASDLIGEYITARCVLDPNVKTAAKALYEDFVAWHKEQAGGEPIKQNTFGRSLTDRGLARLSKERPVAYGGICIAGEPIL